jgi:hypothetical protein
VLTATVIGVPDDAAAPSTSATLLDSPSPSAAWPATSTLMLQGSTVITLPTNSNDGGENVDWKILKMQEPNCVVPVAEFGPETIENAGVVAVLVKATVVVAVVPKAATPAGNAKGMFDTAAVVVGEAARAASVAAT